jgi:hypothetical protein
MKAEDVLSYTLPQAAKRAGFSLKEVTAAVARGDLRAKKATPSSRYRRILLRDLEAWLDSLPDA